MSVPSCSWCILVDVGGVILNEQRGYAARFQCIRKALARRGLEPDDEDFSKAVEDSILSRTPSTHSALVWSYTKPDTAACSEILGEARSALRDWSYDNAHELQPGVAEALATLSTSYTLALAANASASIRHMLASIGVLGYFVHQQVSEDIGLSKPDVRFFLHILHETGFPADRAVMVGDRLDNDILPAQLLGMKTVWVKTGVHAMLEPREPREVPDCIIDSPARLAEAVATVTAGSPSSDR